MKPHWIVAGALIGIVTCMDQPTPARATDVVEVANVGSISPISWPYLIADREGMFTAEGLDVGGCPCSRVRNWCSSSRPVR